jgi:hypothetical protein
MCNHLGRFWISVHHHTTGEDVLASETRYLGPNRIFTGQTVVSMPRSSTPEAPPHLPLHLEATYIAKALVFEGVLLVVAMCYKAIESEVEVFMRAFFEGILTDALDIIEATNKARIEMIQYQLRRAPRFAKEVEIADYVLPVLYRNVQLESMRLKISKTEEDMRGNLVGDG